MTRIVSYQMLFLSRQGVSMTPTFNKKKQLKKSANLCTYIKSEILKYTDSSPKKTFEWIEKYKTAWGKRIASISQEIQTGLLKTFLIIKQGVKMRVEVRRAKKYFSLTQAGNFKLLFMMRKTITGKCYNILLLSVNRRKQHEPHSK